LVDTKIVESAKRPDEQFMFYGA